MKPFDQWFNEAWKAVEVKEEELPDGVYMSGDKLMATCSFCQEDYVIEFDVKDFNQEYSTCNGSDRCAL